MFSLLRVLTNKQGQSICLTDVNITKSNPLFRVYRDDLKLIITQKLKIAQKKLINPFQNIVQCASYETFFFHIWSVKLLTKTIITQKNKSRKIDFSFFSEYCVSFSTKRSKRLFWKGGGGVCMSVTRKNSKALELLQTIIHYIY